MEKKKKQKPFKTIKFGGKYSDFKSFYDENKEEIYINIIEIYKGFKNTNLKVLDLHVSAEIDGFAWRTDFKFHRNHLITLKKDIMPFFEENENYEICNDILNLHKELTNQK